MGKRFNRQVGEDTFEGVSVFEHEGSLASLEEAIEEAMAAARDLGRNAEDETLYDIQIQTTLRMHNQNVKAYSAKATKTGDTLGGET
jgi:hypothetical protein